VAKTINTTPDSADLLPDPRVAERYHVSLRTLSRWDDQLALNFPKAIVINHRKYRRIAELESWERERAAS
jgi:hypothetical protein